MKTAEDAKDAGRYAVSSAIALYPNSASMASISD